ncbi:ATP-binding protein [bacterium]|nr:ATP-binding protein [bacterium]
MWILRDLEAVWSEAGRQSIRIVTGARQCGKSSLLERLAPDFTFVSLDDLQNRQLAQSDPALFFETHPGHLILDEVQHAPLLFSELKRIADAQKAGKLSPRSFWLSGSNLILLRKNVVESLAGRASSVRLHPLSVAEISSTLPDFPLVQSLLLGGWPELYGQSYSLAEAVRFLNDYVQLVLERDVAQSAGIQKVPQFLKFATLLSGRAGNLLELSSLASAVGVQVSTLTDWAGALEQMLVIARLPAYTSELSKRLIKSPKLFFQDTGLLCRLQGWRALEPLLASPMVGAAFENLVFTEILKTRDHALRDWNLTYFRTKEGQEVDFVIDTGSKTLLLECKFSAQNTQYVPTPESARKVFGQDAPIHVVTFAGELRRLREQSWQVPIRQLRQFLLDAL